MSKLPKTLFKNIDFLRKLSNTKSIKKRETLLKEATNEQLLLLIEICYNILKGYFPLSVKQRLKILPYAPFVRRLGRVRTEKRAKEIIQQGGGFVSFAPLLIPIIASAVKELVNG